MESLQVKEYMNHYPVTFTPEMVIEEAAILFLKTKQIGGPVVDGKNQLIGFLSESDILAKMLGSIYHNEQTSDVASSMHNDVLSVKPYDSVIELAQSMLGNKPKIYPVVDDMGTLLGTICRNEVLMAIEKHLHSGFHVGK